MPTHIVQPGEHLAGIATAYGFADAKTIYEHPSNAELKSKRPDSDILHPRDVVNIPDKQPKTAQVDTGRSHNFVLKTGKKVLRLVVRDCSGNFVKNEPFTLEVGGRTIQNKTTASGAIMERVPVDATSATLSMDGFVWHLRIGDLNPLERVPDDGVSGAQMRLANLGYSVGAIDGLLGPRTMGAIITFQRKFRLKRTGKLDTPTLAKLKQRHGC
jgi:N-acetylmuramoyl-L-alanine amidase